MTNMYRMFPNANLAIQGKPANRPTLTTFITTALRSSIMIYLLTLSCLLPAQLQELGVDDRRVSFMGPDGDDTYDGFSAKVAYNTTDNEYLIVWTGDDNTAPLVEGESEIFGQLFNTNGPIGIRFRISDMGPDGDRDYDGSAPAVAYNSTRNEYMVVWHGDDDNNGLLESEFEIFGRRISNLGVPIGVQFRISDMGPVGDDTYDANSPEIAYNSTDDEYLVVWSSDEVLGLMVNNELEIFGQRLDGIGNEIGANDFRISDNGPEGEHSADARSPAVTYNSQDNEYLVVWQGNLDPIPPLNNLCDDEIFGQIISANGIELGTNDFRISFNFSQDGNCSHTVANPHVTYNPDLNEYFVVWQGQDEQVNVGGFIFQLAKEVYGMILDEDGALQLPDDLRLTDVGGDDPQNAGNQLEAGRPVVVYNPQEKEYVVTFEADDDVGGQVNAESEVFVQRVDDQGNQVGLNDHRVSTLGGLGDTNFDGTQPHIVFNATNNEYLLVFQGDDNTLPLVDNEVEIFAQRLGYDAASVNNNCSLAIINVTDELINLSGDTEYRATQSITSDATLAAPFSSFQFQAPNTVDLNNGFTVNVGIGLTIDISNCVSN